jgi:hypothetical protein
MKQILKKSVKVVLSKVHREIFFTNITLVSGSNNSHVFFGYYDMTPFNPKNNALICFHEQERGSKNVNIIIKDLISDKSQVIDSTLAWNFQQGARLTWFDKDSLIFNDFDTIQKKFVSKIIDINTKRCVVLPFPVQAFFKKDYLLSIDYSKLHRQHTEYGYKGQDTSYPEGTIMYYQFKKNRFYEILKEDDCVRILKLRPGVKIKKRHINHISISPSGEYFVFVFRYWLHGKRVDSLLGYELQTKKLSVLIEKQIVSHYTWRNGTELLVWAIINGQPGYYLLDRDGASKLIFETKIDGHPTFIDDNTFITDTYPNKYSMQNFFTYNISAHKRTNMLRVRHPVFYKKDERCDLHPSISDDKKYFQIDLIRKNNRAICIGQL